MVSLSRKMRSLPVSLLFVASALAAVNTNYNGQPIDYFDDNFNSDLKIGPGSTFSFNFEQTRRDQPSQIEMREENVGRYISARPQTTPPPSIFSMNADRQSQHVYQTMTSSNNYHHQQQPQHWNAPQMSPVPPPPKFDFSRPHNSDANWNSAHQNALPNNPYHNFPPHIPSVPTPPSHSIQWTEPPKPQSTPSPYFPATHSNGAQGISFAPSASYVSDSIRNNAPPQPPSLPNRGHHKFSWDDITKKQDEFIPVVNNQQSRPSTPSTPQSIHNKPPPPVPTLSPWYDNFGK